MLAELSNTKMGCAVDVKLVSGRLRVEKMDGMKKQHQVYKYITRYGWVKLI